MIIRIVLVLQFISHDQRDNHESNIQWVYEQDINTILLGSGPYPPHMAVSIGRTNANDDQHVDFRVFPKKNQSHPHVHWLPLTPKKFHLGFSCQSQNQLQTIPCFIAKIMERIGKCLLD